MRKLFAKILAAIMILSIFTSVQLVASEVGVTIDGTSVVFDGQGPTVIDGRTLVPVRGVFEQLGFDVNWNQTAQIVTLTNDNYEVIITIGSNTFTTNGEEHQLDVPAQIIDGRTLVPIRMVLVSVGFGVGWAQDTSTVLVTHPSNLVPLIPPTAYISEQLEFELRLFELVNEQRASHGIPALAWHNELAAAARTHSQSMVLNNFLDHNSLDGTPFYDRISALGISWTDVAENINGGANTPEGMMEWWMNSPPHRVNILNPVLMYLGVGVYPSGDGFVGTQKFFAAP